ncbi:MAG TPA: hypothetical protein VF793_17590 [Telluria sp.]
MPASHRIAGIERIGTDVGRDDGPSDLGTIDQLLQKGGWVRAVEGAQAQMGHDAVVCLHLLEVPVG